MDAYIYQSALYCPDCAADICTRLDALSAPNDGDSEGYPQGPYLNGGGESDSPQHCDCCGLFLENPLTPAGLEHTDYMLRHGLKDPKLHPLHDTWKNFYFGK
jgi:hypothetical protein